MSHGRAIAAVALVALVGVGLWIRVPLLDFDHARGIGTALVLLCLAGFIARDRRALWLGVALGVNAGIVWYAGYDPLSDSSQVDGVVLAIYVLIASLAAVGAGVALASARSTTAA